MRAGLMSGWWLGALLATCACGGTATSPSEATGPTYALSFGPDAAYAVLGGQIGLSPSAEVPITNLRCQSSTHEPVHAVYQQVDWGVYQWTARFSPTTVGDTVISCHADPRASGSTVVHVRRTHPVTMRYVRTYVPEIAVVDPRAGGRLEVNSNFRASDGAMQWPGSCSNIFLAWDQSAQTLTCSVNAFQSVAVDYLNAACVKDPAGGSPGFRGGAIYINDTLVTVPWSGSTPTYQCRLFMLDADGRVGPPR